MNSLIIFTDGGSRGNPGKAAVGVVIKDETGKIIKKIGRKIGETTNNVAEYTAVIEALEWVIKNINCHSRESGNPGSNVWIPDQVRDDKVRSSNKITFYLDSSLVVNQLNGLFKVKNPELRNLILKIRMLEGEIGESISYKLIPREKNWEADALVNMALDNF